jgi:hypothetical protein
MSKPILLAWLMVVGSMAVMASAYATELLPPVSARVHPIHVAPACGPCGCLHVTYVYHRDIRTTYGAGFDPRNYDQTEPHFYLGPVRSHPRFWVCADPAQ